jgi:hypothetical protein
MVTTMMTMVMATEAGRANSNSKPEFMVIPFQWFQTFERVYDTIFY